ncbi:hypothetical protein Tco_1098051 [Tanacetum coccineum]
MTGNKSYLTDYQDYDGGFVAFAGSSKGGRIIGKVLIENLQLEFLWLQNQLLDYGYNFMKTKIHVDNESAICVVKNPVYHSKTKHIEIRHHFIRYSYEKKLFEMVKIHTDYNVADLLTKAFDVDDEAVHKELGDKIERAATTASSFKAEQDSGSGPRGYTLRSGDDSMQQMELMEFVQNCVTHLKLEDNGGITSLPNTEIFEQLALMRGYSGKDVPLFPSMTTAPETSPSRITSSPSLSPQHTSASAPSTSPSPITETTPTAEEPAPMPHESPLQSVQSLGRDESSVSLNELMDLVTQLTNKVGSLENELKNTKKAYGTAITKLVKRVKKLEKQVKTGKASRRTKIVLLEDEAVKEDSSKQGRSLIEKLDMDVDISLVPPHAEIQEKISDETEVLLLYEIKEVVKRGNKRFLLLTLHLILLIYQLVLPVKLLRLILLLKD